jgi:UDP-N-acetylmuramoyl-L-alanyl-D-glutamate--2,6-diaminopimelate ligase
LSLLLDGAAEGAVPALHVDHVEADSRRVKPGDVFFALPGLKVHGDAFLTDVREKGAEAVVSDRVPAVDPGLPVVVVADVRAAYARAAARLASGIPDVMVGVTGTNGKSSVVSFVRQIWAAAGIRGASLGTVGLETDAGLDPRALTTSDPQALHADLAALKAQGIEHVAMETSSQGLDQRRVDGIRFRAVAFTNLSRDHLDYHADMDAYRDAKLRLFTTLLAEGGAAVVNTDDPEHMPFLFAALDRGATVLTVGAEGGYLEIGTVTNEGYAQRVEARLVGEPISFLLPLTGAFQVSNAAMALALAVATGADPAQAVAALNHLKGAKGRLDPVATHKGAAVFVDYAHKPVALESALHALRPFVRNRLILVFGCGGDRDTGKRPIMGAVAENQADVVIVTDDNPRTEDAAGIRRQILAAVPKAEEIPDRRDAIRHAVGMLQDGDVLLIAGKGHEYYQITGTEKQHFSDHEEVLDAIRENQRP